MAFKKFNQIVTQEQNKWRWSTKQVEVVTKQVEVVYKTSGGGHKTSGGGLQNKWRWSTKQVEVVTKQVEVVYKTSGGGHKTSGGGLQNKWRWSTKQVEMVYKTSGVGVLLYIPRSFKPKERSDLTTVSESRFESIWVDCAAAESKRIILMGDYDIDFFQKNEKRKLETLLIPYGLVSCNTNIRTRQSVNKTALIDYIITENFKKCFVTESILNSDHYGTVAILDEKMMMKQMPIKKTFFRQKELF